MSCGELGRNIDESAVPVVVTTRPRMSGATRTSQPGPACGKTAVSGAIPCGTAVTLVSVTTSAVAGRPVPRARNVASTQGCVSAASVFAPPELGQPTPEPADVAGHVGARRAAYADAEVPATRMPPTATSAPVDDHASAPAVPFSPFPTVDHAPPPQRAM